MTLKVFNGSSFVEKTPRVQTSSGNEIPIAVKRWDGASWITEWEKLSVYPLSSFVFGLAADTTSCGTVISESLKVVISGGIAPFTYNWEKVGTTNHVISSVSSSTPTVSGYVCNDNTVVSTWRCTVTDADGETATSQNISVSLSYTQIGGGGGGPPPI